MVYSIFRKKHHQSSLKAPSPIISSPSPINQERSFLPTALADCKHEQHGTQTKLASELLRRNHNWADQVMIHEPHFFNECAKGQHPKILWIGCADSRVPPEQIVSCAPGDIFVHRNIANVCLFSDLNSLSVIQYAVEVLKVEEIVVCGHYGCGGVKAAMENHSYGLIDNWLTNIKSVYQSKKKWLDGLEQTEREALMVELNVINSLHILCQTPVVQSAWSRGQPITVHGWSYNIENGRIYDLNARVTSPNDVEKVYWEAFQTKIHSVKSIGRE